MIRWLVWLALLAVLAAGAAWLADQPGAVALNWSGWRVETSLAVMAFAVAILAFVLAAVLRLLGATRRMPKRVRHARRARRRERGYRALTQGMVAVAAGDADEAHRHARRADALLHDPPLTLLLSAQAAQLGGDADAAKRYFTAMLDRPETAFLGLRGLLMQAERDGDRDEARRLIERAYALRPDTAWVLEALHADRIREGRWREALTAAERAGKLRKGATAQLSANTASLHLALAHEARADGENARAQVFAKRAMRAAPNFLPAVLLRAEMLAAGGRKRAARRLVRDAWAVTPHPDLARLAARLDGADALSRERAIERLVAADPERRESRLALAEAALEAKLWGVARAQLSALAKDTPSAHVCRLMARLEAEDGGDTSAERAWLLRAATAPADPAWGCGTCGATALDWAPKCPNCAAFGTLAWGQAGPAGAALAKPQPAPARIDAHARGA